MATNKSRGSQKGLLQNREDTKKQNTRALWKQVELLRKNKADVTWTYKEVWLGAGLKSNMALNSPWNAHIREAIDNHNKEVKEGSTGSTTANSKATRSLRDENRRLRDELKSMKKQRDKALESIAIHQAEKDELSREVIKLKRHIDRG